MANTRTRRNGGAPAAEQAPEPAAPEQAPEQAPEPEQAPAMDLATAVASEQVSNAKRVYVDVPGVPRVPTADGTLATVQREQRADGTLGEYLLAEVRKTRGSESVQRYSIARIQALKDALGSQDVTVLR